jgi:hypothetical protein
MLYYWRTRGESVLQKHFFGIDKRSGRNVVGRLHQTELAFSAGTLAFASEPFVPRRLHPTFPSREAKSGISTIGHF